MRYLTQAYRKTAGVPRPKSRARHCYQRLAAMGVDLKISSGVGEIDPRCLDAFSRWRYRPAWGDAGYVTSTVAVTRLVHAR